MPEISGADSVATKIGEQTVIRGNCLDVMAGMEEASIDVVVTSPPYNLNMAYGAYDDSRTEGDYVDWIGEVAKQASLAPRTDGNIGPLLT